MLRQYTFEGIVYVVENITDIDEIPFHLERVSQYWEITDYEQFSLKYDTLKASIKLERAFKIVNKDTNEEVLLAYFIPSQKRAMWDGELFWVTRKPFVAMLVKFLINNYPLETVHITISPYAKKIPYGFTITEESVKRWHGSKTPLEIKVNSKEIKELLNRYFKKEGDVDVGIIRPIR